MVAAHPLCSQDLSDETPQQKMALVQKMGGSYPFSLPLSLNLDICVPLTSFGRNRPKRFPERSSSVGIRREFVRADVFKPLTSVISVEGHSDVSLRVFIRQSKAFGHLSCFYDLQRARG